jgi:hypothetical protein
LPLVSLILGLLLWQAPSDLSGTKHSEAVPPELAAPVAATIAAQGVKATVGANTLTFWWVKQAPAATWGEMPEGSLVGAVKVEKDFRDVRGRVIKAGTYTLRYGIQPSNGDHLGVSPFREFLLLSPVSQDTDPSPRGHDGTVEISKLTIGGSHPAVWSLDPPVATEAPLTVHTNETGLKGLIMEMPIAGGTLRFGLILVGKIEA